MKFANWHVTLHLKTCYPYLVFKTRRVEDDAQAFERFLLLKDEVGLKISEIEEKAIKINVHKKT